jgi:DnaJ homolog subfamily B member 4
VTISPFSPKQQTGFSTTLTHLDGKEFTLDVDDVIECDHVLRVHGKGMPRRSGRGFGDLYVTFEVDFPDKLSKQQKEVIKAALLDGSADSGSSEL